MSPSPRSRPASSRWNPRLGTALFVRGRHGRTLPTRAGPSCHTPNAIGALDAGASLLTELRRGGTGELVLGAAPAVSTYVLPALLVRYARGFPNVRLVVRTGHSEEILELAVRRDRPRPGPRAATYPDIEALPLYEDELVLVAAGSHRFGDRTTVGVHELEDARLILFDRTSSYYELTNAFFREAGVAPSGIMELDNIDAAKQMVGQGPRRRSPSPRRSPRSSPTADCPRDRHRGSGADPAAYGGDPAARHRTVRPGRRLPRRPRPGPRSAGEPVRDTTTPGGRSSRPPGASGRTR